MPLSFTAAIAGVLFSGALQAAEQTAPRPNIIVIMCDDAGFADFGFTGGVGKTPVLDRLASEGVVFTRAMSNGRCMPTRQSFMTGLNPQLVHDFDRLSLNCVTLAEVLGTAGYDNYLIGKWHMGDGKTGERTTPLQRGFKYFYGSLAGAVEVNKKNYIRHVEGFKSQGKEPMWLYDNEKIVTPEEMPEDYYESFDWSDRGAEIIRKQPKDKPFFLFMSYTAPHWNLDPLPEYIAKYDGVFDRDWEEIRKEILARQIAKGIMPKDCPLAPLPQTALKENEEEKNKPWMRERRVKNIQIHYASITEMDEGIRRLIDAVKETGRERDTIVLFFSDNGGEALEIHRAMISNTPFAGFKVSSWEGGIATPLLVWWPGTVPAGKLNTQHEIHMEDFMATFVELAGAQYPEEFNGQPIYGLQGRSFVRAMKDPRYAGPARVWAWEHDGSAGVWSHPWKAVYIAPNTVYSKKVYDPEQMGWRLFKLDKHRVEKDDLSATNPDKLKEMTALWKEWAQSVGLRSYFPARKAYLPPEQEDAPRPDPKKWDPTLCPVGRLPKSE